MTTFTKRVFTLITIAATGSSLVAPASVQAQSVADFLKSAGLGLGAGGNCDTDPSTGYGEVRDKDGAVTQRAERTYGGTNCAGSRSLIKHISDSALNNERSLIKGNHTIGLIDSIGSVAVPLLGGLLANFQARPQAAPAPAAPDNSQYLQLIQQQQRQIDEMRALMSGNISTSRQSLDVGRESPEVYKRESPEVYGNRNYAGQWESRPPSRETTYTENYSQGPSVLGLQNDQTCSRESLVIKLPNGQTTCAYPRSPYTPGRYFFDGSALTKLN